MDMEKETMIEKIDELEKRITNLEIIFSKFGDNINKQLNDIEKIIEKISKEVEKYDIQNN